MLIGLRVVSFKRFDEIDVELGNHVVFIGPNNSGKSTALQALALWDVGLRRWQEKRSGKETPRHRSGVTINRRDLLAVPVPSAKLLWKDLHVRKQKGAGAEQGTQNVLIHVVVNGVSDNHEWSCGLEFDYANEESFYCRPLRRQDSTSRRMEIPPEAAQIRIAYLPPMSGLAPVENRLDLGAINVHLGEGRTAEVLRNLCYQAHSRKDESGHAWDKIVNAIRSLFGVNLEEPRYVPERGEVTLRYSESSGANLDISCSGRGLQQTLLLLAHLYANPRTVLLLDEPDAHLEILRQRQIYQVLTTVASENGSQIIAASHSEVLLNEAADRDVVVAFTGKPHRIDDRGSQVLKALKEIGFEQFLLAEQTGFVLYLEGSTDLAILRAFAQTMDHAATGVLERPFVHYVGNQPSKARDHFHGLRDAKPDLVGVALFDRDAPQPLSAEPLREFRWAKREIECYLCHRETLLGYAARSARERAAGPLFSDSETEKSTRAMEEAIAETAAALEKLDRPSPWSGDLKVSEEFLGPVFRTFYNKLGLKNLMRKTDYHVLASCVSADQIDQEVHEVLDIIHKCAERATPLE